MDLDTILFILIGALYIAMAVVGGIMPARNRKYPIVIVVIGLIGVFLIVIQAFRVQESQKQAVASSNKLTKNMDDLLISNKRLEEMLIPFQALAKERFPNLPLSEALEKLKDDLSKLQSRTTVLEQETKKTVFQISNQSPKELEDGTFEIKFTLTPIGKNIIPILRIIFQTENNAKIINFVVDGRTITGASSESIMRDKTRWKREFRNMYPGIVYITIKTDKNPGNWGIHIDPWEKR